jgi:hypothetical protein
MEGGGMLQVVQQYLVRGDNQKCLTLTGEMSVIIYTPSPSPLFFIPSSPLYQT